MRLTGFLLALLVIGLAALPGSSETSATQPPETSLVGDYYYAGLDGSGHKIVEGTLSITSVEADSLNGNWQFHKVRRGGKIGPQVGTGKLIGQITDGQIYINLNPNMADNNVHLRGTLEGRRFHGTWSFDGFAGPMAKGTFEAKKRK